MRSIIGNLTKDLEKHTTAKEVGKNEGYFIKCYRDLVEHVAKLAYKNKDYWLLFRGQKSDFKNKAKRSTFYPTIYRGDYLTQQELDFRFERLYVASKVLSELFEKYEVEGYPELGRKKLIQWSILQHYGVTETPLIDLTHSLRVACSFAQMNNDEKSAFIYVFGLPYLTNRISINSEHDLINIRLLSITPPGALRPYFQEGYLVGTEDITNEYKDKSELDLNNRLIAKFEIPNSPTFWGKDFSQIPKNALYPENDQIESICKEVGQHAKNDIYSLDVGNFLSNWLKLEGQLIEKAQSYYRDTHTIRGALYVLIEEEENKANIFKEVDNLRVFRNQMIHKPTEITNDKLVANTEKLAQIMNSIT